jgi:NlpC/P60 family
VPDDRSEELLARLLTDPEFRARHRREQGRALETLEMRESRQALLGALSAAALEGALLFELAEHGLPDLGGLLGVEEAQAATVRPGGIGALLDNDHVTFDADGIADLRAGRIDARIVAALGELSREHDLVVSSMRSDHPQLTAGGSVSNHFHGRAVDIAMVDGRPVNASNDAARKLAVSLARLDPAFRPDEIGSPWALAGAAYFTDADHQDHIHLGFDEPPGNGAQPHEPPPVGEDDVDDQDVDDEDVDDEDDADEDDADDEDDGDEDDGDEDDGDEDDGDEDDGDEDDGDEDDGDEEEDSNEGLSGDDDDEDEPDEEEPDEEEPDEEEPDEEEPDEEEPGAEEPDEDDLTADESDESDADEDPDSHDDNSDSDDDSDADEDPDSHDDDSDDDDSDDDSDDDDSDAGADYPGDRVERAQLAGWMGQEAKRRGLPRELPVMAALVESGMTNADHGDADSLGFFQMRASVWDRGPYAGYARKPELQLKWFLDTAERVGRERRRHGLPMDPRHYGEWIADVERPAAQFRGRYQLRLDEARELLHAADALPGRVPDSAGPHALAALTAVERRLGQRGLDASQLVQWAYRQAGIELPRDARGQFGGGHPVHGDGLLAGDLVFFRNAAGKVDQVGISLGGHRFISASRGVVEVSNLRDASGFAGARRFDAAVRGRTRDASARVLPVIPS